MNPDLFVFQVQGLDAVIQEGVKLDWEGREIDSGPLEIKLGAPGSGGFIDYRSGKVNVEFRIQIAFPEFAEFLDDIGMEPDVTAPVEGVVRSEGSVFDDHSLRLAGTAELADHRLFDPAETKVEIRAPSQ